MHHGFDLQDGCCWNGQCYAGLDQGIRTMMGAGFNLPRLLCRQQECFGVLVFWGTHPRLRTVRWSLSQQAARVQKLG
jgi:hypothetical protein